VRHGEEELAELPETVRVTFVAKDGSRHPVTGREGERALYLAHRKGIEMEGACEASLACTTWYVNPTVWTVLSLSLVPF